jgi:hypothetical protein
MDKQRCLKLALRIDVGLHAALGEGIDAKRMVAQPLYARDALLVCDALAGTDLPALAAAFRKAAAPETVNPLLRAPLGIASLLGALFGVAAPRARPRTGATGGIKLPPGAAAHRPRPPGRPRRTAVRPPHRRAER